MTTKNEIRSWLQEGREKGMRWMIVVVDEFDYEDYPIFVENDVAEFWRQHDEHNGKNMQRIMEVYDLGENYDLGFALEDQLGIYRVQSLPPRP
jgi:hypothetical protein